MTKEIERAQHVYDKARERLLDVIGKEFPDGTKICHRHCPEIKGEVICRSMIHDGCLVVQSAGMIRHVTWSVLKKLEGEEDVRREED